MPYRTGTAESIRSCTLAACAALACLWSAAPAGAATIDVADGVSIIAADGQCSLAEAINNANDDSQFDNGDCPAGSGFDTLVLPDFSIFNLQAALPTVTSMVLIEGNGSVVQRDILLPPCNPDGVLDAFEFRIFWLTSGLLQVRDARLRNGCADGAANPSSDGAGIRADGGELQLERVVLANNVAWDKSGAIDATNVTVTVVDSTLRDNFAGFGGGAIGNDTTATMTIRGSTISGNIGETEGAGGVGNLGTMTIINSTISGNQARNLDPNFGGGGIGNAGTLNVVNSTIFGNSDDGSGLGPAAGGGIANVGSVTVRNSIVTGSTAGSDCVSLAGSFVAESANLDGDGSCATLDSDFATATPAEIALGLLGDNGGPTQTHAPALGSVAIDAVPSCTFLALPVATDQRGVARPQFSGCDLGAVEVGPRPDGIFSNGFEAAG